MLFGLLIGDAQLRRVIGAMPEPTEAWVQARTEAAVRDFLRLYAAGDLDAGGSDA